MARFMTVAASGGPDFFFRQENMAVHHNGATLHLKVCAAFQVFQRKSRGP